MGGHISNSWQWFLQRDGGELKWRWGQRRLSVILIVHFYLEECFYYLYPLHMQTFFLLYTKSWYSPRLETFANCDPIAPAILVGFVEFFLSLLSFFIKSWEKHLWRIFLRPILLTLEQSHCLSTASFDILSHFPRSGSREEIWSQFDSPPLKKQLSSLHCVWRELVKCAIFFSSIPNAQVCVLRWGKSASWQKCATRILHKKNYFLICLGVWWKAWKYNKKASRLHPLLPKFEIKNRQCGHKCFKRMTNIDWVLYIPTIPWTKSYCYHTHFTGE